MGFLDIVKQGFGSSKRRVKDEELNGYLKATRENLKLASDSLGKFLEGMRDFHPARRHEEIYHNEVRGKIVNMRSGVHHGLIFLDERMNNTINTMNTIRNPDQLKTMIEGWVKNIKTEDEKVYDILKILQVEMWSDDKAKRGFPVPRNKDTICSNLTNAVGYLSEAKNNLDSYASLIAMQEN